LEQFFLPLGELKNFDEIDLKNTTLLTGVIGSQKWHMLAAVMAKHDRKALIITHSELAAKTIYEDMSFFFDDVFVFPARDPLYYVADAKSSDTSHTRFDILKILTEKSKCTVITPAETLVERIIPQRDFVEQIINIKVGDFLYIDELAEKLVNLGYSRASQAEGAGQFAVRGGIVDVYTVLSDVLAVRIEFFGDEVDSIRQLDPLTQRSLEKLQSAEICPLHDTTTKNSTLLDYFSKDTILVFDEPSYIDKHIELFRAEYEENAKQATLKEQNLSGWQKPLEYTATLRLAEKFATLLLSDMNVKSAYFEPKQIEKFRVKTNPPLRHSPQDLKEDLLFWLNKAYRVLILADAEQTGINLANSLAKEGLPARYDENLTKIPPGVVTVSKGTLSEGFEYVDCKFTVITGKEIFPKSIKKKKRKKKNPIAHFSDLKPGDYIVHDNHGVGVFSGIEQIVVDGMTRDYLNIAYKDGSIKIHTAQMDQIQKYIGGRSADGEQLRVKLNRLGGTDWARAKSRVRTAVKILAADLVQLYAKRQAAKGFVYSSDSIWQTEFEALFPYEETEDQLAAIEDVKNDMESTKIMDRLICGDVGYGKTEIAIRAAFKAAQDGKQVAYLVPTTILAQQHYGNFIDRMANYPIAIERLSRFQTAKEQKDTLNAISLGSVDIVIGTHRLLSKDVKFKNLGLIIVDEEQRFGVSHKEKLKAMKADVDVLTLTATPIPRTLHLSLTGLRDMSLLNEPPEERKPVQTYVMEYNPDLVKEAITREIGRGGQVYYLHNRVRNIEEETARVKELVPLVNVAFAHGQMSENQLEDIMIKFGNGEIQVLVCTTIIEAGLDIPNVNTIIIQNADFLGLSQLYQLRGRVGRSNRMAFAYLMYRKDKILDEVASKRLRTIRDFTEFGAGFKIAMRDLEIRGAGNLLGAEQHGHMDAVGYEMYCKLLAEAIDELDGKMKEAEFETSIDVEVNAYIPSHFIEDEQQKIEIYKKIAMIKTQEDWRDVQEEIEDRFGNLPRIVQNLLDIALLKSTANGFGITAINQGEKQLVFTFRPDANIDGAALAAFIITQNGRIFLANDEEPYITCRLKPNENILELLKFIIGNLR